MVNIEQVEKRNKAIIDNAIDWANDRDCLPLEQLDIAIIGACFDIRIPKHFDKFVYSEAKNRAKVTGAHKTIFNTLDKIAEKLRNMEEEQ